MHNMNATSCPGVEALDRLEAINQRFSVFISAFAFFITVYGGALALLCVFILKSRKIDDDNPPIENTRVRRIHIEDDDGVIVQGHVEEVDGVITRGRIEYFV